MMVFFVTIILLLCVSHALPPPLNTTIIPDPEHVVRHLNRKVEESRRRALVSTCLTGNPIDDCWRCDPNWFQNRQRLADCAVGFGRNAAGGKGGAFYTVTDNTDDATNPAPGSLRFGVIQEQPLWIIFSASTTIHLQQELVVNSFKTIDGRGVDVHITGNGCITIQGVSNVIIHNVNVHHCVPAGNAEVRSSPTRVSHRGRTDGDGISIHSSRHIWIDHCSLSYCADGLIDATIASTSLTFSNNHFSNHDKVMLLGHSDSFPADKVMQVTVAFNQFAEALVQRMPRARFGYVHVVNNDYTAWGMYAVGGSAAPTINSQGNRYIAPADESKKEVTKRVGTNENGWGEWNWRSEGDLMVNGAFFVPSGVGGYEMAASVEPMSAAMIDQLTRNAGVMSNGLVGGTGGGGGGSPGGGSGGDGGGSSVGPGEGSGGGGGSGVGPGDGGGGIVGPGGGYGDGNGGHGYGGYGMIYSGGAIARTSTLSTIICCSLIACINLFTLDLVSSFHRTH